ncbi:MAG: InlB B-repeat-containing protein, partial [Bacilli bacterium]|nr:InlB B-repeat-containing protein [Bacilli bacterium]
ALLLSLSVLSAGLAVSAITFNGGFLGTNLMADASYQVVLDKDNGTITATSKKTTFAAAKTKLNNDIEVAYKNVEAVSGKVGKIKAGGYYANSKPISGMSSLVVTSDAAEGDAVITWGRTSACKDGSSDLAGTFSVSGANYFRITAKNDIEVSKIQIELTCDGSDNGAEIIKTDNTVVANPFTATLNGDSYSLKNEATKNTIKAAYIPDYIISGNDAVPVKTLSAIGNTGFFESSGNLEEVYLPAFNDLVLGDYFLYTSNKIKEYTLPYGLSSFQRNSVPRGDLEVLNIESKNAVGTNTVISNDYTGKLKTINVSYDVEFLPNIISDWPSGVTVNYEGTEAEWAALTNVDGTSAMWTATQIDVICSDTTFSTVNLHFANATLDGVEDEKSISIINGKSFADPGKPVYNESAMKFDGWYTAAEGGEKVTFPVTITADTHLYAHFVDWPAGSSINNAKPVIAGETYEWTCDEDSGWYYFSVTSETAKVFMFTVTDVTKTGGAGNNSPYVKFYNSSKAEISVSYSNTAEYDVKQIAKYASGAEEWKIRVGAGETFYMALAINSSGTGYGTGNLNVDVCTTDNAYDYSVATTYTFNEKVIVAPGDQFKKWFKFTPTTTGSYWVENGMKESTVWSDVSIGTITDGVWSQVTNGSVKASSGATTAAIVELTADTEYYICVNANGSGNAVFKISDSTPTGTSKSNPYSLTVGGEAVGSTYQGVGLAYFSFNVVDEGDYIVKYTLTKGTSAPTIKLYANDDTQVTLNNGEVSTEKVAHLEAGTYYITSTVSSYMEAALKVFAVPDGYNRAHAIAFTYPTESDTVTFTNAAASDTKWYKFVAGQNGFAVLSNADFTGTAKIYSSATSSTATATFKNGNVHAKVVSGNTYYVSVTGFEGSVSFTAEYVETIEDGETQDTPFVLTLDEAKSITYVSGGSSSLHLTFTADETCDYVITRVTNTNSMYCYDVTNSDSTVSVKDGASNNEKVISCVSGHTYRFYYSYYSNHTVKVSKVPAGYNFDSAIELTLGDTFNLTSSGSKTYYKFTATQSKYYVFTSSTASAAELYDSSKKSLCSLANGEMHAKLTAESVYYISISGTAGTYEFTLQLQDTVKDGLSAETALDFVFDEGEEYMTIPSITGGNSVIRWYKATGLTPGKEYTFSSNSDKDIDILAVNGSDGVKIETYRVLTAGNSYA